MDAVFRNIEQIVRMEVVADLRTVFFLEQLATLAVQDQNDLVAVIVRVGGCLLYTSDAADDMQCVDLGGRRIIKKIFF